MEIYKIIPKGNLSKYFERNNHCYNFCSESELLVSKCQYFHQRAKFIYFFGSMKNVDRPTGLPDYPKVTLKNLVHQYILVYQIYSYLFSFIVGFRRLVDSV